MLNDMHRLNSTGSSSGLDEESPYAMEDMERDMLFEHTRLGKVR